MPGVNTGITIGRQMIIFKKVRWIDLEKARMARLSVTLPWRYRVWVIARTEHMHTVNSSNVNHLQWNTKIVPRPWFVTGVHIFRDRDIIGSGNDSATVVNVVAWRIRERDHMTLLYMWLTEWSSWTLAASPPGSKLTRVWHNTCRKTT